MEKGRREIQLVKEMISGFLILYNFKLEAGLNLFTCLSCILRHRHPKKTDIQMQTFLTWGEKKIMLLFLSEKKSKPVGYTRTLYLQTGKNTK